MAKIYFFGSLIMKILSLDMLSFFLYVDRGARWDIYEWISIICPTWIFFLF